MFIVRIHTHIYIWMSIVIFSELLIDFNYRSTRYKRKMFNKKNRFRDLKHFETLYLRLKN